MNDRIKELLTHTNMLHFEGEAGNINMILETMEETLGNNVGIVDDTDALYESFTVRRYLSFFADLLGAKGQVSAVVEQMHLADIMKKKILKCTRGEKRRVAVARELLRDADAYFLLNPLEELDAGSQKVILGWMDLFQGGDRKLVTLSHSHCYTCLCPGMHYDIVGEDIVCIDEEEPSDENPEIPTINKIPVTYNEKTFLFNPEEIDYAEANDGQVYVYVRNERYTGAFKMSELEERLAKFGFFRCHRSYIVNMQKVVQLVKWTRNSYSLKLAKYDKTDIPLSKAKIQEIKKMYEF